MSTADNTILGLKMPTDPRWVNLVSIATEDILTDHAFCEMKAATKFISLIQHHPDKTDLVSTLAPIITEEWGHFRMVVAELTKRGFKLGRQRRDEYVNLLLKNEPRHVHHEEKLLHQLMACALIEARSCERFRLLAEGLEEEALRKFYHKFMVSEAGHYRTFIDLAYVYFPEQQVRTTWQQWLDVEAMILLQLEPKGNSIH